MRFIIHEQAYEQPLASGKWRYFRDGKPTGAKEEWRLSEAVDGYRFLRVDLDARAARSGRSYLYHLTMDSERNPVQLKFRFWEGDLEIIGTTLLEKDSIITSRELKGQRLEEILSFPDGYIFWFPSSIGLGLLANTTIEKKESAVSLRTHAESKEQLMAPFTTTLKIRRGEFEEMMIMNNQISLCPLTISWPGQQRKIWVNENYWPMKMERLDGLSAIESRFVYYQRIS